MADTKFTPREDAQILTLVGHLMEDCFNDLDCDEPRFYPKALASVLTVLATLCLDLAEYDKQDGKEKTDDELADMVRATFLMSLKDVREACLNDVDGEDPVDLSVPPGTLLS